MSYSVSRSDDFAILKELARANTSEKRRHLMHAVTDLFLRQEESFSGGEIALFDDILGRVAFDLEDWVRSELSLRMAESQRLPKGLMNKLARDEIGVARPLLSRSACLPDGLLIDIAETRSQDHLLAISKRKTLNVTVTDALVDHGGQRVIRSVAGNGGARLSQDSFAYLTHKAAGDEVISASLGRRADLPGDFAQKILHDITGKLRAQLGPKLDASAAREFQQAIGAIREDFSAEVFDRLTDRPEADAYVENLHSSRLLNQISLAGLARARRVPELISAFSRLSGLDKATVGRIFLSAKPLPLAIACKSQDFDASTFMALLDIHPCKQRLKGTAYFKVMSGYNKLERAASEGIVAFLKSRTAAMDMARAA